MHGHEAHECYVCMETCDTISPCQCNGRYAHRDCLVTMILTSNSARCPVCKCDFPCEIISRSTWIPRVRFFRLWIILSLIIFCSSILYSNIGTVGNTFEVSIQLGIVALSFTFFVGEVCSLLVGNWSMWTQYEDVEFTTLLENA